MWTIRRNCKTNMCLSPCTSDIHTVWEGAIGDRKDMVLGRSENANIPLGGSVLVIGIGAVGLSAIAGAALLGAADIYAAGTRPVSVKVAKEYGATEIINYREAPIDEQVREATNGAGVDSIIIAGGNLTNTWKEAVASTKAGGTISNVNYLSGADDVLIPRVEWGCGMSNINITNGLCPGGRVRMERLSRLALTNRADPELLVTHRFKGLEKIEDALYLMKDKPKDLIKPIVKID